jgi:hypothetical protein
MMITDGALVVMDGARERVALRLGRFLRRRTNAAYQYAAPAATDVVIAAVEAEVDTSASEASMPAEGAAMISREQRHDDWRAREIVLTTEERRARAIALRGLSQCRGRRFDAAFASFVEAAQLDPLIDFARLPDFWRLPTEAHQVAIEAYEVTGRRRDAAALTAAVRSTFRPKALPSRPLARQTVTES